MYKLFYFIGCEEGKNQFRTPHFPGLRSPGRPAVLPSRHVVSAPARPAGSEALHGRGKHDSGARGIADTHLEEVASFLPAKTHQRHAVKEEKQAVIDIRHIMDIDSPLLCGFRS